MSMEGGQQTSTSFKMLEKPLSTSLEWNTIPWEQPCLPSHPHKPPHNIPKRGGGWLCTQPQVPHPLGWGSAALPRHRIRKTQSWKTVPNGKPSSNTEKQAVTPGVTTTAAQPRNGTNELKNSDTETRESVSHESTSSKAKPRKK